MRRPHAPFAPSALLALCILLAPPGALAAQDGGGALPGRLERRFHPRESIEGLSAAENQRLVAATDAAAAALAGHPAVGAPPAGVCLRLSTWYPGGVEGPRARAEVTFSFAERYDARGCSERTTSGVRVRLNDAAGFLHPDGTPVTDMGDDEGPIAIVPRIGTTRDGHDVLLLDRERAVVLTRDGRPLLVPVTKERYLRWRIAEVERAAAGVRSTHVEGGDAYERWLREDKPKMLAAQEEALQAMRSSASPEEIARMRATYAQVMRGAEEAVRAMSAGLAGQDAQKAQALGVVDRQLEELRAALAALSPAERGAQACHPDNLRDILGRCTSSNGYYGLSPDYFSPSLPKSAIQVMVVSTPHVRHNMEAPSHAALRWRVFEELDYGRLAALLR